MSTLFTFVPRAATFPTSNAPELNEDAQGRTYLAFDAAAAETCYWDFDAPAGVTTPLTLTVKYRAASATSGTALFEAAVEAISDGDTLDTDAASSFDADNTPTAVTVPGTAGYIDYLTITLTNNDAIAAGDLCRLRFNRDISDTATGDLQVLKVVMQDAA
jgi:hypothetical protein